ncbi:MAG: hypothetical protein R2844_19105 [Caldilineales bacterium]
MILPTKATPGSSPCGAAASCRTPPIVCWRYGRPTAQHVLHLFEEVQPTDDRPRRAIEATCAWTCGEVTMTQSPAAAAMPWLRQGD